MFIVQKIIRDSHGHVLGMGETVGILTRDAAEEMVRRGTGKIVGEEPDPGPSFEPPGGAPPPALVARLRAEGKLPPIDDVKIDEKRQGHGQGQAQGPKANRAAHK